MMLSCQPINKASKFFIFVLLLSGVFSIQLQIDAAATVVYTYDDNEHLVRATYSKNYVTYHYDKNNNILTQEASQRFSWLLFLPAIITGNSVTNVNVTTNNDAAQKTEK